MTAYTLVRPCKYSYGSDISVKFRHGDFKTVYRAVLCANRAACAKLFVYNGFIPFIFRSLGYLAA